ncbi:hypothetical protein TTHERM_00052180 (macronuclear) [Tetrahymena thermophila SB210]|uniref:Uncharacterized protein n=1 Tax=Tetrahymena thermophila (strain SB210) TaxID=312017 RepID=Q23CX2_TETTS|nr:hypothetical protein TTHERM_00052180 [Tetrahymena thermophila SB210]EAR94525.3 hypothetical protein TTHERM_00052180 [Tetrahymena thermophila SB210]|eukprot:XP_001014914.3 hypothetical protein TTHERM_00052180 [Tetrahymena thermophila SB210]
MDKIEYSLYKVCSKIIAHTQNELPTQQNVHDNTQAKDLCDSVMLKFNEFDQLFDRLTNIVQYLQYDQPEEKKMIDIERQIQEHQNEIWNCGENLNKLHHEFINSPWVNMESVNLMYGRNGQVKMELLDGYNLGMDYKTKQQEKKHLMRKKLLSMKKPPKVDKIKLKDDRCIVKTDIYQINYDLIYDQETDTFNWKIPRTKDIQISDNGLSYLQNFLKDEKSKKDIQTALDQVNKSIIQLKKEIIAQTKERKKRQQLFEAKKEVQEDLIKTEHFNVKQEAQSQNVKLEHYSQPMNVKSEYKGNDALAEDSNIEEEYNYQILCNKYEMMVSYVFCFIDQKIKTLFSDQVLEILQKQDKENLQKKFGPEVVYLQKKSDIKDELKFNYVQIRFKPQTAMLQTVLKQENLIKNKAENNITQTSIFIEHISYDTNTYYQFILSQEKINFYRQIRAKSHQEQKEIIEKIQYYKPSQLIKEKINYKNLIIQEAIKNDLLPKQSFSLTPFDTIYIKSNITLSQIDSTLLRPFINLEDQNQIQVDSLFLIHKPKELIIQPENVDNPSNSDNVSYLRVVIGDKIDLEIILQQYRVIMLQQFFISNYKLSQSLHDENSMHLEVYDEQQASNMVLLIRQKRQLYDEDIKQISINKIQSKYLTQAVFQLQNHPLIKNIIYQVLICVRITCDDLDSKDDKEIYQIIIPYLTDKQHYIIYNSLNEDIIELDSQKEQELDELIQDLQRKEHIIQNFVNTVYIAQAVQKNILHSQFRAISQEQNSDYSQITIECRLKDELNSDKPIKIYIQKNFHINLEYNFGELRNQCKTEEIPRNQSLSSFYKQFTFNLDLNIQKSLKDIYSRYNYLSDDRTRIIKEFLKLKISNDEWFTQHNLKTRPETIVHHPNQQHTGSNQGIQQGINGQQNGLNHYNQQRPNQNQFQNNSIQQQNNSQGLPANQQVVGQGNHQQSGNQQRPYAQNSNFNQQQQPQQSQPGTQVQQNGAMNNSYGQQTGQSTQRNPQQYYQNQQQYGNNNYNNQAQQQQNPNQQGVGQQSGANNYAHMNGAQNSSYNQQQYQNYQPNSNRPN